METKVLYIVINDCEITLKGSLWHHIPFISVGVDQFYSSGSAPPVPPYTKERILVLLMG